MASGAMSETVALDALMGTLADAVQAYDRGANREGARFILEARSMALMLKRQVARGLHANPPLAVVGNPPIRARRTGHGRFVGQIASSVHAIQYTHADDGKDYNHEFGPGVLMFAVRGADGAKDLHLTSDVSMFHGLAKGKPLWEDFD